MSPRAGVPLIALVLAATWPAAAQAPSPPPFTQAQADQGADLYRDNCERCHGSNLNDGEFGPPLKGVPFKNDWGGKGMDELFTYVTAQMPPGQAGVLQPDDYAALLAYILSANDQKPGAKPLPQDPKTLAAFKVPN